MTVRVAVVGAGMAGLLVAAELLRRGIDDLVVLERTDRAGGVASTIRRNGYELEPAAGAVSLPHRALSPILEYVAVPMQPATGSRTRYVFDGARLHPVDLSPALIGSPMLSLRAKVRALAEIRVPPSAPADESADGFMRRRFGDEAGRMAAWLMSSGVFAGDPERLSLASAFPALAALEDEAGSVIRGMIRRQKARPADLPRPGPWLPVGGMRGLADAIVARLGDRFCGRSEVMAVRRQEATWVLEAGTETCADQVVLASGAAHAIDLLGLEAVPPERSPVVVLGVGGEEASVPAPPGFGILATPDAGLVTLGVLLESSYAPHRAPVGHTLVKIIAGGATQPEVSEWDDDRLIDRLGHELARIIGRDVTADHVELVRHHGIPHYVEGHGSWLATLEGRLGRGLHLAGWDYRGVGLSHLAADARRIADAIMGDE